MSLTISPDWRMSTPLPESKKSKGKYADTASPHLKIVHPLWAKRHSMLCQMFPMWSPKAEQVVDYLMGLTSDEFRVLCHHNGLSVTMTQEKLDMIGDALGPVESLTLTLDEGEFDAEPTDAELVAMLTA